MADLPIIFSGPMVRALLEGRKTQTRRILKPQPQPFRHDDGRECDVFLTQIASDPRPRITLGRVITVQEVRFAVGDRLWVRENWRPVHSGDKSRGAQYMADMGRDDTKWRPSIHLPRWASRLTLAVTGVKIERVQAISEDEARAEGAIKAFFSEDTGKWFENFNGTYVCGFAGLWSHINGADAWDQNPFVVAITFSVIRANIDAPEARAA